MAACIGLLVGAEGGAPRADGAAVNPPYPTGKVRGAVIESGPGQVRVDWSRGMVIATAAAAADLRAPSPPVARVGAMRRARQRARALLSQRVAQLPVGSRTVTAHRAADRTVAARLDEALDHLLDLEVRHASDGSVVLSAGLPLQAVRVALGGMRRLEPGKTPVANFATAVIVDARSVLSAPSLLIGLATAAGRRVGPTVFYRDMKAARADPRLGSRAVGIAAKAAKRTDSGLDLELGESREGKTASLSEVERAVDAGALVVIVIGR